MLKSDIHVAIFELFTTIGENFMSFDPLANVTIISLSFIFRILLFLSSSFFKVENLQVRGVLL